MAKKKNQPKAKEPIHLRFKRLANGNQSLYLDCYVDGQRTYEFLRLYLVPEVDAAAKVMNANTMQAAQAIKAQRIMELANGKAGLSRAMHRANILLHDWCVQHTANRIRRGYKHHSSQDFVIRLLDEYSGGGIKLFNVDKAFCLGFIGFLHGYGGNRMSNSTKARYVKIFNAMLNGAVREGLLAQNPMGAVESADKPKEEDGKREYLSLEEIQQLIDTPCSREDVKRAYLFACFCGLRVSDVKQLTWGNVVEESGKHHIAITQQKTQKRIYLPLSEEALAWVPERGAAADADKVFPAFPKCGKHMGAILSSWARAAGVSKHVTFHTSRHTFATMMLTLGVDLYTTSKLLGHGDIKVTQIYAKIVDKKKEEAVNKVHGVFKHSK